MQCGRCAGLRVQEIIEDGGMRALAYRCIHCGDIIDQKILLHRHYLHIPRPTRSRTPVFRTARWKRHKAALS